MQAINYESVWQSCSEHWRTEAINFWQRLNVLPAEVDLAERASQLCCIAHSNGSIVGVSTAQAGRLAQLRARFFFFRCLVDPDVRRQQIARQLAVSSRDALSAWSAQHPEAQMAGMATVVESPLLRELARTPVWPSSGLSLVGYTDNNQQIRVVWFEHARVSI